MERSIQITVFILLTVCLIGSSPKMAPQTPSGRHLSFSKNSNGESKKTNSEVEIKLAPQGTSQGWGQRLIELDSLPTYPTAKPVIIAVIDTGIDTQHSHLKDQLWMNPGESGKDKNGNNKFNNGVDDDGNGFIDDYNGWNFAGNNNRLTDHHGHGTHIAGIIGARGQKVRGVAPSRTRLMVLKYFDPTAHGYDNLKATVDAIHYAIDNGAQIINYSSGGPIKNQLEQAAIERAHRENILVVAAAGNESNNSDFAPYYPANYNFPNVISVTALNPQREILPSSNYGSLSVDLAAPGLDIYSTIPGNQFATMTGTSQATAFVSGLAAHIFNENSKDVGQVIQVLTASGIFEAQHKTRLRTRLHAPRALSMKGHNTSTGPLEGPAAQNQLKEFIKKQRLKQASHL